MSSIFEFVKSARDTYRSETIEVTEGYEFSQYETLRTIELYHNSHFTTGNTDSLGREKPFYNICKFRVNVATRSTDLDTKDVHIVSDRIGGYTQSFLLTLKNRNWMKENDFGVFLNKLGYTRAKYGGVLVKKVEGDGELSLHVVPWLNSITDQVDIRSGVKIERSNWTPADLKTKAPKNWSNIDEAIETAKKSRTASAANEDGKENETPGDTVAVYEIHGVLPTSHLAGKNGYPEDYGSEDEYERQMHVVVLDESQDDKTDGVCLYAGPEDEDPYKYLAWEEVDGRGLGVGVIEDLFESQVWTNYGVKQKKDMLDLAGKIIFQTTDSSLAAKNILTDLENGSIITTAANATLSQVNNVPASLPAFSELVNEWNTQAERVSSTPPSITGENMPSGQPFRLAALLNQEAGSIFTYRRQEAGLFIQEIYRDWILPFLVKQIKKDKELIADLEPEELQLVADAIARFEAAIMAKERILKGEPVTQEDMALTFEEVRQKNLSAGARRAFKLIEDLFENWKGRIDVITTGEQRNKAVMLETLFNIFQVVAKNPQILQDQNLARLFNQMVEMAGISPITLNPGAPAQNPAQELPERISAKTEAA